MRAWVHQAEIDDGERAGLDNRGAGRAHPAPAGEPPAADGRRLAETSDSFYVEPAIMRTRPFGMIVVAAHSGCVAANQSA